MRLADQESTLVMDGPGLVHGFTRGSYALRLFIGETGVPAC